MNDSNVIARRSDASSLSLRAVHSTGGAQGASSEVPIPDSSRAAPFAADHPAGRQQVQPGGQHLQRPEAPGRQRLQRRRPEDQPGDRPSQPRGTGAQREGAIKPGKVAAGGPPPRVVRRSKSVRVQYRTSVSRLTEAVDRLDERSPISAWGDTDILDASEGEAANSVAALNALLDQAPAKDPTGAEVEELQATVVDRELARLDTDLDARWRGALFALHPRNPDAARHFCTSTREMLSDMLDIVAPSHLVEMDDPSCARTQQGSVSRRARIRFCLRRSGTYDKVLEDFVEEDITNVLALFREFNEGTHGAAGRFTLGQLNALKIRAEDAIRFIIRIAADSS